MQKLKSTGKFFVFTGIFLLYRRRDTIISMSTAYGADVGLSATDMIIALLAVQIVAAPFAMLFGSLAKKFGTKTMLYAGICIYIFICTYAFFMKTAVDFWILAMLVATA